MPESSTASPQSPPHRPRLVLIVSDGPLLVGDPEQVAGRAASHAAIRVPPLGIPALATTVATGVDALVHGIVTDSMVDPDTLKIRPTLWSDCRFPTFWTAAAEQGLHTLTIDWPATADDPDLPDAIPPTTINAAVRALSSTDAQPLATLLPEDISDEDTQRGIRFLARMGETLAHANAAIAYETPPDLLAMVLRSGDTIVKDTSLAAFMQQRIESFIENLSTDTAVLIVRRWIAPDDTVARTIPYAMTLIGGPQHPSVRNPAVTLQSLGGGVHMLAGLTCPHGVAVPKWPFLTIHNAQDRPLALGAVEDPTDWDALVQRVLAVTDETGRRKATAVLISRFAQLSAVALMRQRWADLEPIAKRLVTLRGNPQDYWLRIYAADRRGNKADLPEAINAMVEAHGDHVVTNVARCLELITSDQDKTRAILQDIEPAKLPIKSALGMLGRLCLHTGLNQQGTSAIRQAIQLAVATGADRTLLATHLLKDGRPDEAWTAIGRVGKPPGNRMWCLLRLRILLALGRRDQAQQLAAEILEQYPADVKVLQLMQT